MLQPARGGTHIKMQSFMFVFDHFSGEINSLNCTNLSYITNKQIEILTSITITKAMKRGQKLKRLKYSHSTVSHQLNHEYFNQVNTNEWHFPKWSIKDKWVKCSVVSMRCHRCSNAFVLYSNFEQQWSYFVQVVLLKSNQLNLLVNLLILLWLSILYFVVTSTNRIEYALCR